HYLDHPKFCSSLSNLRSYLIPIPHRHCCLGIFNLWERRKTVARLLVILSVVYVPILFITTIECARTALSINISRLFARMFLTPLSLEFLLVSPGSKFCGFSSFKSPWLAIAFGLLTGADLVIVVLVILNAMARPRRANHGLVFALHRDGAAMYTVVLVTRIVALIITIIYDTNFEILDFNELHNVTTHYRYLDDCQLSADDSGCETTGFAVHSHWVST
ncbi:hypothetical protein BD779DRAFT_1755109, partial [Infundibulicybe gibba]